MVQVQRVFLGEELVGRGAIAGQLRVPQGSDVAAGAEGAVAGTLDHHGVDVRVLPPGLQDGGAGADHRQVERVQRSGAVEQDAAHAPVAAGHDGGFGCHAAIS